VTAVFSPGDYNYCALLTNATLKCWGANTDGLLGAGLKERQSPVPVAAKNLTGVKDMPTLPGGSNTNCALLRDGTVKCWGTNLDGALGSGSTGTSSNVPVAVKGVSGAVSLVGAELGFCVLLHGGGVDCWGDNTLGELGAGVTATSSSGAVPVKGLTGAVSLAGTDWTNCALLRTGGAKCWGDNSSGQLGAGTSVQTSKVPLPVSGLTGAVRLFAGFVNFCALLRSGGAKCWGSDGGNLGDGGIGFQSNVAVAVKGLG
jgi:alpha-tubulin suppressor-like RCC1 family protein